jgi:hypothetical protein
MYMMGGIANTHHFLVLHWQGSHQPAHTIARHANLLTQAVTTGLALRVPRERPESVLRLSGSWESQSGDSHVRSCSVEGAIWAGPYLWPQENW